jgi:hypothetical protein
MAISRMQPDTHPHPQFELNSDKIVYVINTVVGFRCTVEQLIRSSDIKAGRRGLTKIQFKFVASARLRGV